MDKLERAITTAPILVAPRLGFPFVTGIVSSGKGIAVVLRQQQENDLKTGYKCPWISAYKQALLKDEASHELIDYFLHDAVLYKTPPQLHQEPQLVLPEDLSLKNQLIAQVHCSNYGVALLGAKKCSNCQNRNVE
ncbi:hypothetical protein ANCDUO_07137 [Ancylostoma duodenale]|uniref:Uncharacterized protein n=1 Tax=Ancylostoma duodenale TaxID=51022 RepID=A0A0C2DJ93_9BILA|nr:hypothetical protein ANCDUO_07137 [Ancylostoma duodenale]